METLKFVIVGHVDHGKSTLIGRLLYDTGSISQDKIEEIKGISSDLGRETELAYLLDHLEEERQQGITIDTTQVFFKSQERLYVIIDAPGHVEFVKNMITGASQAEAALLIVDANEGIKEQTKRHAYILSMLGLKNIVAVFNKMDLVGYREERFEELKKDIRSFMDSIKMDIAFFIPVSAKEGDNVVKRSKNMNWYKGTTILESLDLLEKRTAGKTISLIFPVQDVYKIDSKRIAVGRIVIGSMKSGQKVKIFPDKKETVVKSIEKFSEDVNSAYAGESIGITTQDSVFIDRGNVVCQNDEDVKLTDVFNANIFWLSEKDFDINERITIRCATQEVTCRVRHIKKRIDSSTLKVIQEDADILKNLEVGEVEIKTKKPIAVRKFVDVPEFGRFVLVRDEGICAGGIINAIR